MTDESQEEAAATIRAFWHYLNRLRHEDKMTGRIANRLLEIIRVIERSSGQLHAAATAKAWME